MTVAKRKIKPKPLILTGLDPSYRNFGMVRFEFDHRGLFPIDEKLIVTEKADKKAKVRVNCDDLERSRTIFTAMQDFIAGSDYIFMEMPVGSQSASGMKSYGICVGLAASIEIPLILVLPNEVKVATGLSKTASKEEMRKWAYKKYPDVQWLRAHNKPNGAFTAANEHLADACAAVEAGIKTPEFQRLLPLIKKAW
jgi:hypothetical protein